MKLISREVIPNLITTANELETAVQHLRRLQIPIQRLAKELDVSEVMFYHWRHGNNPVPRYAAIYLWAFYALGKKEVAALPQKAATVRATSASPSAAAA